MRDTTTTFARQFDRRRRELGMSIATLERRSGVPMRTVKHVLAGNDTRQSTAAAIAKALGLEVRLAASASAIDLQERQARGKAEQLVAMVQATSGLECQAVDAETRERMVRELVRRYMAGSKRNLWADVVGEPTLMDGTKVAQ